MARNIDGTEISRVMRAEMAQQVAELQAQGVTPGLSVVLVGNNPASQAYVASKTRACEALGMRGQTLNLPEDVSREELFAVIDRLNQDPAVHGILVQLPLPAHLPYKAVLEHIDPDKDVDGFHPRNAGLAFVGDPRAFIPCTPAGILEMLRRENVPTRGRHVVIVGRSLIVSKPLASLLMAPGPDATVTITHRHTPDLASFTRQADILIVAVGKQNLITRDMVKPGVVVIDVGQNRVEDPGSARGFRMVGDVDFDGVSQVAEAITPVPGGVGPMTITMLLANTLQAARQSAQARRT
ncbi:bifunctional 5,10-methylenetetrahydrofolate dehydrogenase/5,10-methenyltetrahydrofolate cyclohydrolase [Myxococcus sp. AB025B]|uniref:bifunctional 5,10-methylenetetrahydrofolate dehydrogenase/5,10-methenyltetrahydrofolate cyclohydrolase n=1 Tax=Myxococcus sp. AB025B TaxID=2562794 RepID=UPI00114194AC|nr:tetrahydrofolate dehydrogenase/cyclohydrolase catalytic domain-containing protein [Myxococcus sp. AB025B]